jgi:hypothetical protein
MASFGRKIASGFTRAFHWIFGAPRPLTSRERRLWRKAKVREVMKSK